MASERKNKVRETDEVEEAPKRSPRRNASKEASEGFFPKLKAFVRDGRTHKVAGLMLVLGAGYLLVAFVSYLFTWKLDQDLTNRSWGVLLSREVQAENWLGKLGALLSHRFIRTWFGIASFTFVLWSFLGGMRILLGTWLLPFKRSLTWTALTLLWLPAALGFVFRSGDMAFLGGAVGYTINGHLTGLIGNFGAGALLIFSLGAVLTVVFDPSFEWLGKLLQKKAPAVEAVEEVVEEPVVKSNRAKREMEVAAAAEVPFVPAPTPSMELEVEPAVVEPMMDEALRDPGSEPGVTDDNEEETEEEEVGIELEMGDSAVEEVVLDPILAAVPMSVDGMSVEAPKEEKTLSEDQIEEKLKEFGEYDPTLDLSSYELPPIDLLVDHGTGELTVTKEELEANKDRIVETLGHYNIGIDKIKATIGPTVTLYEIIPQAGVRISKIKNLEDDIALSLAALGIRIIAPIPGKGTIGIEVPNSKPQVVGMRAVIASEKFQNSTADLPIVLGKTITNETFVTDLTKMPHLLMAGATGQGKSVGLNAILVSLLYKKHPSQIKFVLVDPKKVELTLFNKIERHFLAKLPGDSDAIITDTKKVVATLNSLCIEMDDRYELLKDAQVRNIKEYNTKFIQRRLNPENGHRYLPYIVLVVDEFADLIMTAGREVETPIARLAQLARAIGIHLIIATQRPSVNIITGTIKANFPARIAFRVTSKIDSRTILDTGGADQLIGRGDMLLSTGNELIRIQCAFVDTPEVDKITEFIGNQRGYPDALLLPEPPMEEGEGGVDLDDGERDSMFEEAARLVVQTQQGSTSLIQRKLKLGYNRAGRIVDQLEAAGILGGFEGSKARRVMIPNEQALHAHLNAGVTAGAGPGMGGF
ncbi:MAG: DNA translocase FtsK 4TM domain-containing protein [Flavobacteriales bacterium]|nr:DNA translocase FtsK 4TM domain-containing protein [Flavobacteriales bacterium]